MRHITRPALPLLLLFLGFAFAVDRTPAVAQDGGKMPAGVHAMKASNGKMVLADAKGMTLYTFAKDTKGTSNCNDGCAKNWPPLMAAADAKPMGDWTIVKRADGSMQWAYKGMPLYTWVKDMKPGDATGDGVGAWAAATP